jgi:hypothetical protein
MDVFEQEKAELVAQAENIISNLQENPDNFEVLRAYNRWYTSAIGFVNIHAEERQREFELIHESNQHNLSSERPNLNEFKINLFKQLGTIEGSSDHYPKVVRFR